MGRPSAVMPLETARTRGSSDSSRPDGSIRRFGSSSVDVRVRCYPRGVAARPETLDDLELFAQNLATPARWVWPKVPEKPPWCRSVIAEEGPSTICSRRELEKLMMHQTAAGHSMWLGGYRYAA